MYRPPWSRTIDPTMGLPLSLGAAVIAGCVVASFAPRSAEMPLFGGLGAADDVLVVKLGAGAGAGAVAVAGPWPGGPAIGPTVAENAVAEPNEFDSVTATRGDSPTSAEVGT